MSHRRRPLRTHFASRFSVSLAATAMLGACNAQSELPPVEATKPSEDARILNATNMMSDGTPVLPHVIDTIETSIEMVSTGAIGGVSIDPDGNVFNTNFARNVWRTAPDGTTVLLNGEFTAASGNYALDNGDLLQSDWREHKIYRISPDGSREVFAEGGLDGPVGIATGAKRQLSSSRTTPANILRACPLTAARRKRCWKTRTCKGRTA